MGTPRTQNSSTERIEIYLVDSAGNSLTSASDVLISIRRESDDYYLDFNDNTFKNTGWTTRQAAMTELNSTYDAGVYYYNFDTTGFVDDNYIVRIECASAVNVPQFEELKVGGYVDNIDDTISTKATPADVNTQVTSLLNTTIASGSEDGSIRDVLRSQHLSRVKGAVDTSTFTSTRIQFETDLTEATADHYNGRILTFTSGDLDGQQTVIKNYVYSANNKGKLTVSILTEAPANAITFEIT